MQHDGAPTPKGQIAGRARLPEAYCSKSPGWMRCCFSFPGCRHPITHLIEARLVHGVLGLLQLLLVVLRLDLQVIARRDCGRVRFESISEAENEVA